MQDKNQRYERIEALIHQQITDRLKSVRGFRNKEWHDWPGTKALSIPAADAVFAELEREAAELKRLALEPGRIEMLCEERVAPSREDRAYQVLCALLSSPRAPKGETAGDLALIAWTLVSVMEEQGQQKDEE